MTARFGEGILREVENPSVVVADRRVVELHTLPPWDAPRVEVEANKDLETWSGLLDRFIQLGLDRDAVVVAVGGGTLLDLAGFAAATYLRGVRWIAVPTTLLAQVDAAHGGKTAIDHPTAKNLVGAFHPPVEVWVEARFLETLPERELRGGMAELIKHAVIGAPHLLERDDLVSCVEEAARVKLDIVERDPYEKGERRLLNLGHTFGHGIEQAGGYRDLHHGECVAIGLRAACAIAERHCGFRDRAAVEEALDRYGLPRSAEVDYAVVRAAMRHDKKRAGERLRWVLPVALGDVRVFEDVPDDLADEVCNGCLTRST